MNIRPVSQYEWRPGEWRPCILLDHQRAENLLDGELFQVEDIDSGHTYWRTPDEVR